MIIIIIVTTIIYLKSIIQAKTFNKQMHNYNKIHKITDTYNLYNGNSNLFLNINNIYADNFVNIPLIHYSKFRIICI